MSTLKLRAQHGPRGARRGPSSYEAELADLLALGAAAAAHAPTHRDAFESWRAATSGILDTPDDPLTLETALDEAMRELRRLCLAAAHHATDQTLRSPTISEDIRRPDGRRIEFGYERDLDPGPIERRIAAQQPTTWASAHLAFSSGQAAMASLALALRAILPTAHGRLHLRHYGGYFETKALFKLHEAAGQYRYEQRLDQRGSSAETPDLVIFEPVFYDGVQNLRVGDLQALRRLLLGAEKPVVLVIDATLIGLEFPLEQFLASLPRFNGLAILLRSGLKLDQAGLELANIGLMSIHGGAASRPGVAALAEALREIRTLTGACLSFDAINALSFPWCLEAGAMHGYCAPLFANNALLAERLGRGGAFRIVAHPRLQPDAPDWAKAPFCILRLKDDSEGSYREIAARIHAGAEKLRCRIDQGGSFGFRGHRFDVVLPEDGTPPFLRVAMGARTGPGRDAVIALLQGL